VERQVFRGISAGRTTNNYGAVIRGIFLNAGRRAAGTQKRDFIESCRENDTRIVPTGNLRGGSDSTERYRQCRSMQSLANMTNRVRTAVVLVEQAAATSEIQQREANQRRANTP